MQDRKSAEAMMGSPDLAAKMKKAGVIGTPKVRC
jgi:hypothetical protein